MVSWDDREKRPLIPITLRVNFRIERAIVQQKDWGQPPPAVQPLPHSLRNMQQKRAGGGRPLKQPLPWKAGYGMTLRALPHARVQVTQEDKTQHC